MIVIFHWRHMNLVTGRAHVDWQGRGPRGIVGPHGEAECAVRGRAPAPGSPVSARAL